MLPEFQSSVIIGYTMSNTNDASLVIIADVPIFMAGRAIDGREVSRSELAGIYATTLDAVEHRGLRVPITIGHSERAQWQREAPAAGYVKNFRLERRGENEFIIADFELQPSIAESIARREYAAVSAEIGYEGWMSGDRNKIDDYPQYISSVALLGESSPAFPELSFFSARKPHEYFNALAFQCNKRNYKKESMMNKLTGLFRRKSFEKKTYDVAKMLESIGTIQTMLADMADYLKEMGGGMVDEAPKEEMEGEMQDEEKKDEEKEDEESLSSYAKSELKALKAENAALRREKWRAGFAALQQSGYVVEDDWDEYYSLCERQGESFAKRFYTISAMHSAPPQGVVRSIFSSTPTGAVSYDREQARRLGLSEADILRFEQAQADPEIRDKIAAVMAAMKSPLGK